MPFIYIINILFQNSVHIGIKLPIEYLSLMIYIFIYFFSSVLYAMLINILHVLFLNLYVNITCIGNAGVDIAYIGSVVADVDF